MMGKGWIVKFDKAKILRSRSDGDQAVGERLFAGSEEEEPRQIRCV